VELDVVDGVGQVVPTPSAGGNPYVVRDFTTAPMKFQNNVWWSAAVCHRDADEACDGWC